MNQKWIIMNKKWVCEREVSLNDLNESDGTTLSYLGLWVGLRCGSTFNKKVDPIMATDRTQKSPSPVKLVSMNLLDAREMGGGRWRHYLVISGSVGSEDWDVTQISMKNNHTRMVGITNGWLWLVKTWRKNSFKKKKKKWICDRFVIIIPSCDGSRIIETNSGDIWESMISNE